MNESVGRQGLWSVPGDGVLARQGDLILLSAIDERGLVEKLLDVLAKISEGGGDGRRFADAVEDLVESDETWGGGHEGQPGPAVIAVGPVGAGLAVTVSGTAWAEVTTAHGTDRLAAGQPATVLRCVVGIPVHAVRGGLGTGHGVGNRTDRFSRLERGTIRADGLSYHTGLAAAPVAAPPQGSAAPEAPVLLADDVAAPGPAAEEAAGAREWPYPAEPPAIQPDAVVPTAATGPETTGPETAEHGTAEHGTAEHGTVQPAAMEPAALPQAGPVHPATETFQVPDFEATQVPDLGAAQVPDLGAAQVPDLGAAQVPDLGAAPVAQPPGAAVPAREATGPAEMPPLPFAGGPGDGTGAAAAGAPIVLGVYCKNGHFGDPNARSCAVCGVSRNRRGMVPQPGPRPPLGALVLDDDSAVELNADCVVGREPTLDPSVVAGEAHPLCINDEAVSRVHARVHLDGWRVFLMDLGSVNGTRIRPPGKRSDQALQPNVPVPLQSGTRVFVGTQGFRYESHHGR